jgi:hypothetical protein
MGGGGLILYLYGLCFCLTSLVLLTAFGLVALDRIQRRRAGKGPRYRARTLPIRRSSAPHGEEPPAD